MHTQIRHDLSKYQVILPLIDQWFVYDQSYIHSHHNMVRLPFTFSRYHIIRDRSGRTQLISFVACIGIALVTWNHLQIFTKESTDRKRMELYEDLMAISDDPKTQQELLKAYGFTPETIPKPKANTN